VLSENDLLACCGFECGDGCEGGYPIRAWQYFKRTGVVTDKVFYRKLATFRCRSILFVNSDPCSNFAHALSGFHF
jgi:hypothetical protein